MNTLATGLSYFDLEYLGTPRIIATGIVHGAAGVSIIDPGPVDHVAGAPRRPGAFGHVARAMCAASC